MSLFSIELQVITFASIAPALRRKPEEGFSMSRLPQIEPELADPETSRPPRFLARGDVARAWRERLAPRVTAMLRACDSVVLATADADGHPHVQHRGGPPGWLHVLDDRTLAFADFAGNRQYTT